MNKYRYRIKEAELFAIRDHVNRELAAYKNNLDPTGRQWIDIQERKHEIQEKIGHLQWRKASGVYNE